MDERRYNLTILPSAQKELEEIARIHLALSGPRSARAVTEKLYAAMEQLQRFPLSGPAIRDDQLRGAGYRYVLAAQYLIFYRLLENTVVVYHIAHGSTDYPKLLKTAFF